jgi:hypothetical protein
MAAIHHLQTFQNVQEHWVEQPIQLIALFIYRHWLADPQGSGEKNFASSSPFKRGE